MLLHEFLKKSFFHYSTFTHSAGRVCISWVIHGLRRIVVLFLLYDSSLKIWIPQLNFRKHLSTLVYWNTMSTNSFHVNCSFIYILAEMSWDIQFWISVLSAPNIFLWKFAANYVYNPFLIYKKEIPFKRKWIVRKVFIIVT